MFMNRKTQYCQDVSVAHPDLLTAVKISASYFMDIQFDTKVNMER